MIEPLEIIQPEKIPLPKVYYVDKYDDLCEKHFKIDKIVPLKRPTWKTVLNIILNICTVLIINYLYGFFNKLVKIMKYDECPLDEAELVGVYCKDGQFYFVELQKIDLPNVDNPDVLTSQSNASRECYLFTFKLFTYIFNPNTNGFNAIKYSIYHTKEEIFSVMSKGLTRDERKYQQYIYGDCDLFFHIDSFFRALFKNTCNFFFAFQIYSIILWNCTEYYAYAGLIAAMTLFDLLEETITNLSNLKSIRRMARYSIPVKVYHKSLDGDIQSIEIQSSNLVPGDIFEVPDDGMAMPCDCILLTGSVIINEAMLTGESTPIIKSHLPNIKQNFDEENDTKYFLFAGTKIVQKRPENKKPVIALVYSTGFNSVKGNLIRSILYPVEMDSKFAQESVKFMAFMAILCVVGWLSVLPVKIIRAREEEDEEERYKAYKEICLQGLDLITTAVPPSLPCCLGVGIGIAQRRFKKKGIMCINRDKITSAGKIDICVFDKTGTLTEDHLNIAGFLPVEAHSKDENQIDLNTSGSHNMFIFDQYYDSVQALSSNNFEYYKSKINNKDAISKKKELTQLYIECLACCQGITRVKGKLIGDPIDVEMFESTGWELIEEPEDVNNYDTRITTYVRPNGEKSLTEKLEGLNGLLVDPNNEEIKSRLNDHYELGIVRRFDFSSKLQRMSTLVKNLILPNYTCYCKGSPEKLKELCQPKTIPADFNEKLNYYTSRGYRVLAMGSKVIQMDFDKALEVNRTFCEKDLVFLGLLIVQNKLKLPTNETLRTLSHRGHIRVRMATGDNIMTAVCVGRKSNLIEPNAVVYSCEIEDEPDNLIEEDKDKDNDNIDTSKRASVGVYENSLNIQKEKERKKKKLVWKTIESYKDDEENLDEGGGVGENLLIKRNDFQNRASFDNRLSCLIPQEVGEEDTKIEDEGNALIKVIKEEKVLTEEDEENTIEIDLSTLPFNQDQDEGEIEIAITGKNFETLYRLNQKYEKLVIKKSPSRATSYNNNIDNEKTESLLEYKIEDQSKFDQLKSFHDAFRLVLRYCSIYARCSPENKTQIVQSLQKESFTVLMCGDGANDCGALKVADVGISLSQEEASIAAPFTSRTPDISCVIDVLKEGKCALVTSLQTFKYILLYSLIQFISVTLLILIDSYLSDWEFMASDLFLITPLAFLIPLAPAYDRLTYHRPVSSLFSFSIIFSMALQTLCVGAFQIFGYFLTDSYFPSNYSPLFYELRYCWGDFDLMSKEDRPLDLYFVPDENEDEEEEDDEEEEEIDEEEEEENAEEEEEENAEEEEEQNADEEEENNDDEEEEENAEEENVDDSDGNKDGLKDIILNKLNKADLKINEGDNQDEEEEEEFEDPKIMYQECIDNSTNFYISFAQYLILAVVFCTGKPFKKSIFYNYGMFIFSVIGFLYAEYIVFYVDYFSRKWIYISPYPDDPFYDYGVDENGTRNYKDRHSIPFKYYIMMIIIINFIICLIIEKVIVPRCNRLWRKNRMRKLERQLELDVEKKSDLNLINTVKNYIREQKKAASLEEEDKI
jgi:cation-transporting ATPase 13A3/4/5